MNMTKQRVSAAVRNAMEGAKQRPPPSPAALREALLVAARLVDKTSEAFGDIAQADENARLLIAAAAEQSDLNLNNGQLLSALSLAGAILIEYADVHKAAKEGAQAARWRDDILMCGQLLAARVGAFQAQ